MPIDFPNSPTTNATYTINGQSWRYNGTGWVKTTLNVNIPTQTGNSGRYLTTDGTTVSWAVGTPGYTGSRGQDGVIGYNGSVGYTGSAGPSSITAINNQQNTGTSALGLPAGTTAQRPGTAYNGYARINTDTTFLEIYYNGSWISAASLSVVPGAPTIGLATSTGPTTATVAFTAPSNNGGSVITSYTAVSSPGGVTTTLSQAGSGTITVTGLSGGTAYTFVVYATNSAGNSANSGPSNSITTVGTPNTLDFLVVAGGGGGGSGTPNSRSGGGGGAGGYRSSVTGYASGGGAAAETAITPVAGAVYTITVGAGGAAIPARATNDYINGNQGSASSIVSVSAGFSLTTVGGGGGTMESSSPTKSGGSGGGSWYSNVGPGSGTAGQGYAGGSGSGDILKGGGGGGAGSAGSNGSSTGAGGAGVDSPISSTTNAVTTRASGGGGSGFSPGASGGSGGGGTGGVSTTGNGGNGTTNTGGGGGGASNGLLSGAGGKGVVILRHSSIYPIATTTGSPTISSGGGYRIYVFNSDGTISWS